MAERKKVEFRSYSEFINPVDPTKEEEACLLRSGLIYPSNPALIPQKYQMSTTITRSTSHLHTSPHSHHHSNNNVQNQGEFYKKLYRCYMCCLEYTKKESLDKHIKMRHLVNYTKISDIVVPKWYCTKCKKEFSHKVNNDCKEIRHFCLNSKQSIDSLDNAKKKMNIKLCSIHNNNDNCDRDAMSIKRIRYESRVNNELESIEQWLKYELIKDKLSRNDYVNASKMFIAVQGYQIAIELLEKCQSLFPEIDDDAEDDELTLIDVAEKLMKQSK